ncbi:MAG: DegT/DnrJ/EryC1/StrS family aminotransferase [Betaproteobacteria bacterium]|nr:DegT/DnrJ/EryC1/StrS family aminotransferase [Betaproteobacteria bacterium]
MNIKSTSSVMGLLEAFADPNIDDVYIADLDTFILRDEFRKTLKANFSHLFTVLDVINQIGADARGRRPHERKNIPVACPYLGVEEFKNYIDAYLSGWISSQGDYVKEFERKFAEKLEANFAVSCSNGTAALQLALLALGIGRGDSVLVPDFTFAATANAVLSVGATPILVDSEPNTFGLDPLKAEKLIRPDTRAIIPVHVFGNVCDIGSLLELANKYSLFVIEDNAEALGSRFRDRYTGTLGHIGTFSFFANKMITTGEGGMCVTRDYVIAEKMREVRDHGMKAERRYWHARMGLNLRMTNPQAAIGLAQLSRLDEMIEQRRTLENAYLKALSSIKSVEMVGAKSTESENVVWFVSCLVPGHARQRIINDAKLAQIDIRPFFSSLSSMPAFEIYGRSCPVSLNLSGRGINLPTHSVVDEETILKIAEILRKATNKKY